MNSAQESAALASEATDLSQKLHASIHGDDGPQPRTSDGSVVGSSLATAGKEVFVSPNSVTQLSEMTDLKGLLGDLDAVRVSKPKSPFEVDEPNKEVHFDASAAVPEEEKAPEGGRKHKERKRSPKRSPRKMASTGTTPAPKKTSRLMRKTKSVEERPEKSKQPDESKSNEGCVAASKTKHDEKPEKCKELDESSSIQGHRTRKTEKTGKKKDMDVSNSSQGHRQRVKNLRKVIGNDSESTPDGSRGSMTWAKMPSNSSIHTLPTDIDLEEVKNPKPVLSGLKWSSVFQKVEEEVWNEPVEKKEEEDTSDKGSDKGGASSSSAKKQESTKADASRDLAASIFFPNFSKESNKGDENASGKDSSDAEKLDDSSAKSNTSKSILKKLVNTIPDATTKVAASIFFPQSSKAECRKEQQDIEDDADGIDEDIGSDPGAGRKMSYMNMSTNLANLDNGALAHLDLEPPQKSSPSGVRHSLAAPGAHKFGLGGMIEKSTDGQRPDALLRNSDNTAPPDLGMLSKSLALPSGRTRNSSLRSSDNSAPADVGAPRRSKSTRSPKHSPKSRRRKTDCRASDASAPADTSTAFARGANPATGSLEFRSSEMSTTPDLGVFSKSTRSTQIPARARVNDFRSSASAVENPARTRMDDFRNSASVVEGRRRIDDGLRCSTRERGRLRRSESAAAPPTASSPKPVGRAGRRRGGSVEDRRRQFRMSQDTSANPGIAPATLARDTSEPMAGPPKLARGISEPVAVNGGLGAGLNDAPDKTDMSLSIAERRQRRKQRRDEKDRLAKPNLFRGASEPTATKDESGLGDQEGQISVSLSERHQGKDGNDRSRNFSPRRHSSATSPIRSSTRKRRDVAALQKDQLAYVVESMPVLGPFPEEIDEEPNVVTKKVNKKKSTKPKKMSEAQKKSPQKKPQQKPATKDDVWSIMPTTSLTTTMTGLTKAMETTVAAAGGAAGAAAKAAAEGAEQMTLGITRRKSGNALTQLLGSFPAVPSGGKDRSTIDVSGRVGLSHRRLQSEHGTSTRKNPQAILGPTMASKDDHYVDFH